jgi:hypothetical protein
MIDYILNPYVLINVLWMITIIIVALIIKVKQLNFLENEK